MNLKGFMTKFGAYIAALVLFVAAAVIYCFPAMQGKIIYGEDDLNWRGAAEEVLEYSDENPNGSWWSNSQFCGMPDYQVGGGVYKSDKLLAPVNSFSEKAVHSPVWQIIFYLLGFYLLLLSFGVSPWLSIAGAFAIAFSSYFLTIIPAGHNTKVATIAITAMTFAGFRFIFKKKYILGAILTMVMVSSAYTKHPQMFYYYFLMMGLIWLADLYVHIKEKTVKDLVVATLIFVFSVGIGIGTRTSNLFANREFVTQTTRSGSELDNSQAADDQASSSTGGIDLDYATNWSYGIDETLTFLIPGFKGGANQVNVGTNSKLAKLLNAHNVAPSYTKGLCEEAPMYWGTQPSTSGNVYVGAIICFLFILGLLVVKGPYKWALLASTIFSITLAWGKNFMWLTELFYKYFPFYDKFRAVSSVLIVAEIAMPLLGILALKEIFAGNVDKKKLFRSIYISAGVTAGICLFFAIFGSMIYDFHYIHDDQWNANVPDWLMDAIYTQRAAILRSDSLRSFAFIIASAAILWLYAKGKLKEYLSIGLIGALILVDLWGVNKRYFNSSDFVTPAKHANTFEMEPWEKLIIGDPDPDYRVLNLTGRTYNESRTSYRFKSLGGYSSVKLSRYQDIINEQLTKGRMPVINMLNAKYFIIKDENDSVVVRQNAAALGNAWWVNDIKMVNGAREEMDALTKYDLRYTAVVDESFREYFSTTTPGLPQISNIEVVTCKPNFIEYSANSDRDGVVVFSEIYYPFGWKVTVDGKPAALFRANYILRAMQMPKGRHMIRFEFDPQSVKKGDAIATAFIIVMYLCIAAGLGYWGYTVYKRKKKGANA